MVKLKPCPFCGSKTAYIAQNYMGQHYVRCPDCGCTMWGLDTDEEVTEKQAAACWNKRADVRPVVRGKWGNRWFCSNMSGYEYACSCSECGEPTYRMSLLEKMPNFCPNCGAKMEES